MRMDCKSASSAPGACGVAKGTRELKTGRGATIRDGSAPLPCGGRPSLLLHGALPRPPARRLEVVEPPLDPRLLSHLRFEELGDEPHAVVPREHRRRLRGDVVHDPAEGRPRDGPDCGLEHRVHQLTRAAVRALQHARGGARRRERAVVWPEARLGEAGAARGERHAGVAQLVLDGLAERENESLARVVHRLRRRRREGGDRRDVEDVAASLLDHGAAEVVDVARVGAHVEIDHVRVLAPVHLVKDAVKARARVVDENRDVETHLLHLLPELLRRILECQVLRHHFRLHAEGAALLGALRQLGRGARHEDDVVAARGHLTRDRVADAVRGASDEAPAIPGLNLGKARAAAAAVVNHPVGHPQKDAHDGLEEQVQHKQRQRDECHDLVEQRNRRACVNLDAEGAVGQNGDQFLSAGVGDCVQLAFQAPHPLHGRRLGLAISPVYPRPGPVCL
mmetsp:Transcript_38410/g.115981  ORF Transcript_38410/g.115981 Transcript_38410/m.115981 type:complete len:451 (+) Transcript_38410:120-1472(+)